VISQGSHDHLTCRRRGIWRSRHYGFAAWLMWGLLHLRTLTDGHSRVSIVGNWLRLLITYRRGFAVDCGALTESAPTRRRRAAQTRAGDAYEARAAQALVAAFRLKVARPEDTGMMTARAVAGCARSRSRNLRGRLESRSTISGPTAVATRRQPLALLAVHPADPLRRTSRRSCSATSSLGLATSTRGVRRLCMRRWSAASAGHVLATSNRHLNGA
jgi:hypothetical protein